MDFDVVIIGAGVVGLAVGRALKNETDKICLIEKNNSYGLEISSRNSEVIHSGIYYPKGSLKSKLCIDGNRLLYKYCNDKSIPYKKCGKLIIANNVDDQASLLELQNNADLLDIKYSYLNKKQIKKIEPLIKAEYAIHLESAGVIDSHAFMSSLNNELIESDISIAFKTEVTGISQISNGYKLNIKNPDNSNTIVSTKVLVNCAGLYSNSIFSMVGVKDDQCQIQFWKGSYFWINNKKAKSISSLIYPVPNHGLSGLGIHLTKGLDKRVKLGPDAEFLGESLQFDYSINTNKRKKYYESCKEYLPFLELENIEPDFAGIRPKLQKPGEKFRDFIIRNENANGYKNIINLIGIESPGLTSSLAIGKYIKQIINWD